MKLIRKNDQINKPISLVIGNLDGLHIAHRKLIESCIENAREHVRKSGVLTFMPHPREFFFGKGPERILPYNIKDYILEKMGVDYLIIFDFDSQSANMEPEDFVEQVLVQRLHVRHIAVGFNYRFGRYKRGDTELLKKLGKKFGFSVEVQGEIKTHGRRISSTAIRRYINEGKVDKAAVLLGYYPVLQGIVEKGQKLGSSIGFPTANISLRENLLAPAQGVYAGWIRTVEGTYRAIVNIGVKPTVGEGLSRTIEAHLIDYRGDLYNQKITIAFTRQLREEKKFSDLDTLKKQLEADRQLSIQLQEDEDPEIAMFPDDLYP